MARTAKTTAGASKEVQLVKTDSLVVVYGDDDFSVQVKGREIFAAWTAEVGGSDTEIINATAENSSAAQAALDKLSMALQSLPFFGGCKLIWFKDCNFLGEDRTASSQTVTKGLNEFAETLKTFLWLGVRLLITAGKISANRTLFKVLSKVATMEYCESISAQDRGWEAKMEMWISREVQKRGKTMDRRAIATMVLFVGANLRQMNSELEKLVLYGGERPAITQKDVEMVVTRNKHAKSFALTDAIGDRDLPRAMRLLDMSLAEVKVDSSVSVLGILYGIISKVRLMLLLRELLDKGYIQEGKVGGYGNVQKLELPAGLLPEEKKFNPALMHPWMVSRCIPQARKYSVPELVRAMSRLLECNRKMVYSGGSPGLALQQVVIDIISGRQ